MGFVNSNLPHLRGWSKLYINLSVKTGCSGILITKSLTLPQALWYSNYEFLANWQGKKVYARYDLADLSKVRAYDEKDRFIAELPLRDELTQEYFADKEDIKKAMQYKSGYKKYIKDLHNERTIEIADRMTALEIVMGKADENLSNGFDYDVPIEEYRYNEEKASPYAKAVGDDADSELISQMLKGIIKNTQRNGGEE